MPISNRCTGMNLFNHLSQKKNVEVKVNYEQVKHFSNRDFFIKHADNLVNLNTHQREQPEWLNSFAAKSKFNRNDCYNHFWARYLDKSLWVCSMEFTYSNKKYNYYSISTTQQDSLDKLMLKHQDSIKNILHM